MSIYLRGKKFHYRFQLQGADYSGVCVGCEVFPDMNQRELAAARKKAMQFEADEKFRIAKESKDRIDTEREIRKNKSVRALVENYKYELTGGRPIPLTEAFPLAEAKPSKRKAKSSYATLRKTYWEDFVRFLCDTYPEIKDLASVRRAHCEAYVNYLVDNGRYVKEVSYSAPGKREKTTAVSYVRDYKISAKTIKEIVGVAKWVFSRLDEDAGLFHNPWEKVILPSIEQTDREVFSPHELRLIWDGIQVNPFCYVLFVVAANSGMTEGDICTLEWGDVDWASEYIRRDRRKTGANISLPLLPDLAAYLHTLPKLGKYVFPEHAEMYLRQPSCVSSRVKDFLHELGIVTTVEIPGRRAVSIKDLHSMRHVFCYRAKRAGIPESIIAKFVGHKVLAMTHHYADHDTDEELRAEIKKLPPLFMGEAGGMDTGATSRQKLAQLAYSLPLETVEQLLGQLVPALPLSASRLLGASSQVLA